MKKRTMILKATLACWVAVASLPSCFGQPPDTPPSTADTMAAKPHDHVDDQKLPRFGIAVGVGTLGASLQVGTAVAKHTNIRGGFNYFSLGLSGTSSDNLSYNATLRLSSAEVLVDQYLKGPIHISGGALLYDGFKGTGNVSVPGGQSLTLNSVTYYSAASNPVTGTAEIGARKVAPEVLLGFGNLLPRGTRHFTVNFDLGVVFQGSPNAKLNLLGSTCNTPNGTCLSISSNSSVQTNIAAEQLKVNNDLKPFQFYPVIRLTFGYKFGAR